jgi:hypothetical protein
MNRNHTLFCFVLLGMLLGPWAIQGLKAQDFQYVPNPANTPRWPPTPKPDHYPYDPFAILTSRKVKPTVIVRGVHGDVRFAKEDQWPAVKPKMQFGPGTALRAGLDSYADFVVNGISVVRVAEDTTLQFQKMVRTSTKRSADTQTVLDLKSGTILGHVKKLSPKSSYEITTPHGVASIRGTVFEVSVLQQANGEPAVTFNCGTGELVCSAVENGLKIVKVLRFGECWTAGDKDIKPVPPALLNAIMCF